MPTSCLPPAAGRREHADQARDSKVLATMRRDLPLDVDPSELVSAPPDRSTLKEIFRRFEFRALLGRVDTLDAALPAADIEMESEASPGARVRGGAPATAQGLLGVASPTAGSPPPPRRGGRLGGRVGRDRPAPRHGRVAATTPSGGGSARARGRHADRRLSRGSRPRRLPDRRSRARSTGSSSSRSRRRRRRPPRSCGAPRRPGASRRSCGPGCGSGGSSRSTTRSSCR